MKTLDENKKLANEILDDFCQNPIMYNDDAIGNMAFLLDNCPDALAEFFEDMESSFGDNPKDWEFHESKYSEQGCRHIYINEAESWIEAYRLEHLYDVEGEYPSRGLSYNDFKWRE